MNPPEAETVSILLVDDQPARLLAYEAILSDLGQRLVRAGSGIEALDRLMKEEFAVILLDVSMPGMDGFETAALVHQHPRFEKTPIIFVTAHNVTDLDKLKGYELGAVDYVYVPVVPQILRSKVAVLVELHTKRLELQRANRSLELANEALRAEKTHELQKLNHTLEARNAELAGANASLVAEVAERERLAKALREADRRKDEFLAMLAHELRNPLAPILSAVHILRSRDTRDPEILWCREAIARQADHLTRLVDDLLDVSRITQGKIKLHLERVAISTVVERATEACRPLVDQLRHKLEIELPDEELWVEGDATRLAQVLGNLINNSAKYTDAGGAIRVSASREGADGDERVVIRVRDTGVGIPPEMLPRVFELFTQVDRTLDRAQGGLGIGLALVRRLVELHGGTVTAASAGPGTGSEFIVSLPPQGAAPSGGREREPSVFAAPGTSLRVLVVDDNVDAALSLSMLLESWGHDVEIAHDGLEALESAERVRPEVVLLDVGMPRLDGCGVAKLLRSQPWGRKATLVAVTGWGQDDVRERTRESGFDAHLVKPVDMRELAAILARFVRTTEAAAR